MNQQATMQSIRWSREIDTTPDRAFEIFTRDLASWWPAEYTWSGDVMETIALEPRQGGRCYELGPHGFQCDWGRVLAWEPGERLVLAWQISPRREPEPNPAKASEVEISFNRNGARTMVEFEHRHIDRHGEGSDDYRKALASEAGWPWILSRYVERVAGDA